MKPTIVFDMDGVIFDTERLILSGWRYLAGKYDITGLDEVFYQCIGTNKEETRKIILSHYGAPFPYDRLMKESSELFHERVKKDGMPIKPGVRELLSFLRINGYRVGLASSTRKEVIVSELSQTGMLDFFEVIVGGDMVKRSKPAPDIYIEACQRMKADPQNTYAVEDSKNGLKSALAAGLKVHLVPDLISPDEEMKQMAYAVWPSLIELRQHLADSRE